MKYLIGMLLIFQLCYGVSRMWFHQDDLNWMMLAKKSYAEQFTTPVTEHINYLFRVMFKTEYELFGWNYNYYLVVSLLLHAATIIMVGLITKEVTERKELGWGAAGVFAINTNWNEVVLWVSGQTISITVFFVLLTIYWVIREAEWKRVSLAMALASVTSGLAAWLPVATLLVYRKEKRAKVISVVVLGAILAIYFGASSGVSGEIGKNLMLMIEVASLAIVNTVLGRLWWPFEVGERVRILITIIGVGWGLWRVKIREVLRNRKILLLIISLAGYYAMVAIGRAQYGVGMMRAERYAYMGLALILPIIFFLVKEVKKDGIRLVVVGIILVQVVGFITRANRYVERPQELRVFHERIMSLDKHNCYQDMNLPWYIFQNDNTKLSEYSSLWRGLVIGGSECRAI